MPEPAGMKSIRSLYKIGRGPSSSHTIGPERATRQFRQAHPDAEAFRVTLYESLCKTGKGHGTDRVLYEVLAPLPTEVIFCEETPSDVTHPNTMDFAALRGGQVYDTARVLSVGGGDIQFAGQKEDAPEVYPENSFAEVEQFCRFRSLDLAEYVEFNEGHDIWPFLADIWQAMKKSVQDGLQAEGILPGGLKIERKAKMLYHHQDPGEVPQVRECRIISSYAFAVSEQNADCGTIVTAPTCGACGVIPAALLYMQQQRSFTDEQMLPGLAVAGLIGNLIRHNASISGAEGGCQAEVGSASGMAAAALVYVMGGTPGQMAHACAMALSNTLGLVCDPVAGLVEVPCVNRNVMGAVNALSCAEMALSGVESAIPCDEVIDAMRAVGDALPASLRETGSGGLAATPTGRRLAERL